MYKRTIYDSYSLPVQVDKILELAQKYNLRVIEDAAEAFAYILDTYQNYDWYEAWVGSVATLPDEQKPYQIETINRNNRTEFVRNFDSQNPLSIQSPWASFNIKGHAGGTNYTSDSFYAGENGRTELITGAAGKKVYTAFETSEILRNIREAEELLPYFNQMRSAASIQPKTLMTAFESPRQTIIEFTHAPVIHTQSGNAAEIQAILEEEIQLKMNCK